MPIQDQGTDLIAYDDAGRVVLVAEVKSRIGTSETWAAQFRRNVLAHGTTPNASFFLIATPERMYFWKQREPSLTDQHPDFTVDTTQEFKQFFDKLEMTPHGVSDHALGLLVSSWLSNLASTGDMRAKKDPSMQWLADSGLIASLERARIETTPA